MALAMNRRIQTLDLSPRENVHMEPRPIIDVWEIVGVTVLVMLVYVILVLVLA